MEMESFILLSLILSRIEKSGPLTSCYSVGKKCQGTHSVHTSQI